MIDGQWEKQEFDALQSLQEEFVDFAQSLGALKKDMVSMKQWPLFQQFVVHKLAELQARREPQIQSIGERAFVGLGFINAGRIGDHFESVLFATKSKLSAELEAEKYRSGGSRVEIHEVELR